MTRRYGAACRSEDATWTRSHGPVYRRRVSWLTRARESLAATGRVLLLTAASLSAAACTTVDPGPHFVVPDQQFDADYFFCHVEPELLFARRCGAGDPGVDPPNSCHFNSSAVSGMALVDHPPVDCGGGDRPISRGSIGPSSPAQGNLQATSLEMSRDYLTAPLFVRPTGQNHPRTVLAPDDPVVEVIRQWAQR